MRFATDDVAVQIVPHVVQQPCVVVLFQRDGSQPPDGDRLRTLQCEEGEVPKAVPAGGKALGFRVIGEGADGADLVALRALRDTWRSDDGKTALAKQPGRQEESGSSSSSGDDGEGSGGSSSSGESLPPSPRGASFDPLRQGGVSSFERLLRFLEISDGTGAFKPPRSISGGISDPAALLQLTGSRDSPLDVWPARAILNHYNSKEARLGRGGAPNAGWGDPRLLVTCEDNAITDGTLHGVDLASDQYVAWEHECHRTYYEHEQPDFGLMIQDAINGGERGMFADEDW